MSIFRKKTRRVMPTPVVTISNSMRVEDWTIGPIINGRNYSESMPLHPTGTADGWYFDFPIGQDGVHYVTRPMGESGRGRIDMEYRIDSDYDTQWTPVNDSASGGRMRLFLQRRGDNWSGAGAFRSFRFWSRPMSLGPGQVAFGEQLVPGQWTNVVGEHDEAGFRGLLGDLATVGFSFGNTFAGHGVYVSKPARFTLLRFGLF